jgi:hypothetical protein
MHNPSTISNRFAASIIFTQLEIGIFTPFSSLKFQRFGPLATLMYCIKIWKETQLHGVHLRPATGETWLPTPLSHEDISIMELATGSYNSKGAYLINRCRLYLQVISIMDLLLYNLTAIHPSYLAGEIPPSCQSTLYWPNFPNPPKHYWKLWHHFIHTIVKPLLQKIKGFMG